MKHLVLIKIGGGLITDKTRPFTVREDMLRASAEGIRFAAEKNPDSHFIVGNGAGSFGHYLASQETSTTSEERIAAIHQSVVKLNEIFIQHLHDAGLSAVAIVPSTYLTAANGVFENFDMQGIEKALEENLVPTLFGDIVNDGTKKGMIFSTEMLLLILAERLHERFELSTVYVGETDGVLNTDGSVIPEISSQSWKSMGLIIEAPKGYDVTGGMQHKVESALQMTKCAKSVYIVSGKDPKNITTALSGGRVGTKIVA